MSGSGGRKDEERREGKRERARKTAFLLPSDLLSGPSVDCIAAAHTDEGRFSFSTHAHDKLPKTSSQRKTHPRGMLYQIPRYPLAQPNTYVTLAITDAHTLLSKEKNVLESGWRWCVWCV